MLKLPQPAILIEGEFGLVQSGVMHTFHLKNAGRVKLTGFWSSSDGVYNYYDGVEIDAGDREGELEWLQAWIRSGTKRIIRVNHAKRTIALITYV